MATNSHYFLPSEIARLVLGYLQTECYSSSYKSFLKECPHLEEYAIYLKRGQSYPLTINGLTLIQMLEDYASLKITDTQRRQYDPSVSNLWKQFDSVVQCLKAQTGNKFFRVEGKLQNARMRTQRITFKREQNENKIKKICQNEEPAKQSDVPKKSIIKILNAGEIEDGTGLTGTSINTLSSSALHHDIVDSTSCDSDPHVDSTSVNDINSHALPQTFEINQIPQTTDLQMFETGQISKTSDLQTCSTPRISRTSDSSEQLNHTTPGSVDRKVLDKRYCDSKSPAPVNVTTSDRIYHADNLQVPGSKEYQLANSIPPSPVIQGGHVISSVPVYTNESSSGFTVANSPAVVLNVNNNHVHVSSVSTVQSPCSYTKINSPLTNCNSQTLMPSLNKVQSSCELSINSCPAVVSNNDIEKTKPTVTEISSSVSHENEIGSSCTIASTKDNLSSLKPPENNIGSVTLDNKNQTEANTILSVDNLLNSSLSNDKLQTNQLDHQARCADDEMTIPINTTVQQLTKSELGNTSDIHKSPRRKRPPRKRSADTKAERKLHFIEHNESSNSTEEGSTVTQDDSLPTIIYEHLLKSTQLQELLAENINKQLQQDVSKHLPSSDDANTTKTKTEDPPDPFIDKNPFTPSQSLEDILDPQETQMTTSQINDIIEMTSNDPVFDSLFNLFEIDKNSYSDHSSEIMDQSKEVEKWINSDDVQNSTYNQSFNDLHTSLPHSPPAEPYHTPEQNMSKLLCTASSSTQPTDMQIIPQSLPVLPVSCSTSNTGLSHLPSICTALSETSATYSSTREITSSETVLIQSTTPGFKKVQKTVINSSHGFPVLSLKSLSNSDEDDNDVTDFPMDVSEIATPNISILSAPSQISVTSPPYSVTSSHILMTSAGSALVTSTMCNVSSVSSVKENKSNTSYMSFVKGMELNQNSSTPVGGERTRVSNLSDNSLAFLGLPTHVRSASSPSKKQDKHDAKNNSKVCTDIDQTEENKVSPSAKDKSPCRSTSTWSACFKALMLLASPDKKQTYETLMQNMGEKPSTGKPKAKRTRSAKKSKPHKQEKPSQSVSRQSQLQSGTPADMKCESRSTKSCMSTTANQEPMLSMPVNFLTPMKTSNVISGSSDEKLNLLTAKSNQENFAPSSEQRSVDKNNSQVQSNETGRRSKGSRKKRLTINDITDRDFLNSSESEEYCYSPTTLDKDENSIDGTIEKTTTENNQKMTENVKDTITAETGTRNATLKNSTENSLDKSEIIYTAIPIGKAKPKEVHVRSLDFGSTDILGMNQILSGTSRRKIVSKARPRMKPAFGHMTGQFIVGRDRKCLDKKDDKTEIYLEKSDTDLDKSNSNLDKSKSDLDKSTKFLDKTNSNSDFIPDAAGNTYAFGRKFVKSDRSKVKKKGNHLTSQTSNLFKHSGAESSDHFDDDLPDPSLPPIILSKSSSIGTHKKAENSKLSPLVNVEQDEKMVNKFSQDLFPQTDESCSQISRASSLSQNISPGKLFELPSSMSMDKNIGFFERTKSTSIDKNVSFNEGTKSNHEVKLKTVDRVYGQFSDISDNSMSNQPTKGMTKSVNNTKLSFSEINLQQFAKSKNDLSAKTENDDRKKGCLDIQNGSYDSSIKCLKNNSEKVSTEMSDTTSKISNAVNTGSKNNCSTAKESNSHLGSSKVSTPNRNCNNTFVQITDSHGKHLTIPAGYETKVQTPPLSKPCMGRIDSVSSDDEIDIEGDWENPWVNTCNMNSSLPDQTLTNNDSPHINKTVPADEISSVDSVQFHSDNPGMEISQNKKNNIQINSGDSGQIYSDDLKQSICDSVGGNVQISGGNNTLSCDSNSNSLTMNSFNKLVNSVSKLCNKASVNLIQNNRIGNKVPNTTVVPSSPLQSFQPPDNAVVISDDSNLVKSSCHSNRKSCPGSSTKITGSHQKSTSGKNTYLSKDGKTLKSPSQSFSTVGKPNRTPSNKKISNVGEFDENKLSFQSYRDHIEDSHSRASIDSQQSDSTQSVSSHCSYQSAGSINMAAMMMTPPKKRITASMKSGTGLYFISRQSSKSDNIGTKVSSPKSQKTPKKRIGTPDKNKLARRSPRLKGVTNNSSQHSKLSRNSRSASLSAPSSCSSVKDNSSPNSKKSGNKVLSVLPKSTSFVEKGGQKRQREDNSILSPQSPVKKKVKKAKKPYDMANLDIEKFLTKIHKS